MNLSLTPRTLNTLRTVHCISACGWIGGGLAVLVLLKLAGAPAGNEEALALQRSIIAVDDYLIIPSAGIATVTGLLLCSAKPWGIDHRWIKDKCIITFLLLVFGACWLAPDLQSLVPAETEGPILDIAYHRHWAWGSGAALLQTLGLLLLVGLSIVKPEKSRTLRAGTGSPRAPKL